MENEEQKEVFTTTTPGWNCKRSVLRVRKQGLCNDPASAACGYCPNHCQKERCEAHSGTSRR